MQYVYAAFAAPGGENDIVALTKQNSVRQLENCQWKNLSDNAYVCSQTFLNPFSGVEKDETIEGCIQYLFMSIEDMYRADTWNYDNKMENLTATSASKSENFWENIYVH